jgi:hypothetical protein
MPSGFSMAVEGGAAEAKRRRSFTRSLQWEQLDPRLWQALADSGTRYMIRNDGGDFAPFDLTMQGPLDKYLTRDIEGPYSSLSAAKGRAAMIEREGGAEVVIEHQLLGVREGAAESKKRLWQPPPGSGLWLTHSSLNSKTLLMLGENNVLGSYDTRGEAEAAARKVLEREVEVVEVNEGRRPKA